eukprot:s1286_g3.t1
MNLGTESQVCLEIILQFSTDPWLSQLGFRPIFLWKTGTTARDASGKENPNRGDLESSHYGLEPWTFASYIVDGHLLNTPKDLDASL